MWDLVDLADALVDKVLTPLPPVEIVDGHAAVWDLLDKANAATWF